MAGGLGDDVYVVDNVGDKVVETDPAGGRDTVRSSIAYALGANVENLVLTGANAINGTGNALANTLTGNAAANRLDGGAGADVMEGRPATTSTSSTMPATGGRGAAHRRQGHGARARSASRWSPMSRT